MMLRRLGAALVLALLCVLAVRRMAHPPAPLPANAPDTVFSAQRAMRHVAEVAARPHALGMPDHDRVRDYIVAQLGALGLRPQIQQATGLSTRYRSAGRVQNILAWLPGQASQRQAVLLMAHYDGVEAGPAAADDGAGVAILLETVRALRASGARLGHDVIILFTDGEEAGLLGAAAFTREHPWARDVAVVINVEARGTTGRSVMFETGPGNLDVARVLRSAGDVTAGSVYAAVYRILPNDTDLSELAVLGLPALNFAFAGGVERYHTGHDDVAHLDAGSVQQQGAEALALVRAFANGSLPRPHTGDGVYFDLPLVGLVVYPAWLAPLFALVAMVLAAFVAVRDRRGIVVGLGAGLAGVAAAGLLVRPVAGWLQAVQSRMPWGGVVAWSPIHAAAVALLSVAVALACRAAVRRWSTESGLDAAALLVWLIPAGATAIWAPAASYLFAWPLLCAAGAALVPETSRWKPAAGWLAAAVAILIMIGFAYGVSAVMLGVGADGATVLGVLAAMVALLLAPRIRDVTGERSGAGAAWTAAAAFALLPVGLVTVRRSADHPVPTALAYVENADSAGAWFGSFGGARGAWTRSAIGATAPAPSWMRGLPGGTVFSGRAAERVALPAPTATLVRDTVLQGMRRLVLRVNAPAGTTALVIRASGAPVTSATIDGRLVDTTRYRRPSRDWATTYWAVPDSGAVVALSIPSGASIDLHLTARRPGLPVVEGVTAPPRPDDVVPAGTGDATYVYRRLRF